MDFSHLNLDDILPHRRRMRLVGGIESVDAGGGVFLVPVLASSPFLDASGTFKPSWAVELVAQAVACHCGWTWLGREDRPGTFGYVVAVDDYAILRICRPWAGETIRVRIVKDFDMPPAGVFTGVVIFGGLVIARATLKTFIESKHGSLGEERHGAQEGFGHGR